jgi:CheY-like chemotaxis protein
MDHKQSTASPTATAGRAAVLEGAAALEREVARLDAGVAAERTRNTRSHAGVDELRGPVWRERVAADRREALTPLLTGTSVLVVDDNADLRDLFAVALGDLGAEVTTVASASEAVEVFRQTAPDAIVCDVFLPEHDGYWVVRQVRASERGRGRTPAVAVTGYDSPTARAEADAAGFDVQMVKPIDVEDLADVIVWLREGSTARGPGEREP